MSDPIHDSLSPFGDDAHMEALAAMRRTMPDGDHALLVSFARVYVMRAEAAKREHHRCVEDAAAAISALREYEESRGLAPAEVGS